MTKYYISNTGSNSNDGLSPSTPWLDLAYAVDQGVTGSEFNQILLMTDVDFDAATNVFGGNAQFYARLSSIDSTRKKVFIKQKPGGVNTAIFAQNLMIGIEWIWDSNTRGTSTQPCYINNLGIAQDCKFTFTSNDSGHYLWVNQGVFINSEIDMSGTTNHKLETFDDMQMFNCVLNAVRFDFDGEDDFTNLSFTRCTFFECESTNNSSYIFSKSGFGEPVINLNNCSILLEQGQAVADCADQNRIATTITDSVIETKSGGASGVVIGNLSTDMDGYLSLRNNVLFNTITHNPIYSIFTENITVTLTTNWKSIVFGNADFMRLNSDSPAVKYTDIENIDAGAYQSPGAFVFPDITDVRDGITYGIGASGDRTGNLTLPAEEDVEIGVEYGANGNEFTGTLVIPVPPEAYDLREGVTVGTVTGILRVPPASKVESGYEFDRTDAPLTGTMDAVFPQAGPFSIIVYTSDGSNISGTTPQASITVRVESGTLINDILSDLGCSETFESGTTLVRNSQNSQDLNIRIDR